MRKKEYTISLVIGLFLIFASIILSVVIVEIESNTKQLLDKFSIYIATLFFLGLTIVIVTNYHYIKRYYTKSLLGLLIGFFVNVITFGVIIPNLPVLSQLTTVILNAYFKCSGEGCWIFMFLVGSVYSSAIGLFLALFAGGLNKTKK